MGRIHANNQRNWIVSSLALAIAIGAGLLTARWITHPIQRVAQAAQEITQGALDQHIASSPIIEIEALAKSFNSMAGQLEQSFDALAASEERFRSLVSNVPGAIYRSQCGWSQDNETWTMEFISDSIVTLSGYPAIDFTLNQVRTYDSLIHPDDRVMRQGLMKRALANQETFTLEYRIKHQDGSIRWVHEQGRGIFGPDGYPIYCDGAIFDITAQQQAEEALRQSEATNRALVSSMPDLLIRMQGDGTHLGIVSSDRLSVLNRELTVAGNHSAYELLPQELAERRMFHVQRALETGEMQVYEQCLEIDGQPQYEEVRIVVVQGNEVLAIVRDITARKQAEEALRVANEELEDRVERRTAELRAEKERSEQLLLNILPKPIAEQLKHRGESPAKHFEAATILFADIVGFTALAARMEPMELVNWLNQIFSAFDHLAEKHRLEKIKTIGDAYMVVGGLPVPRPDHAEAIANMALEMQACMSKFCNEYGESLQIRIGINTGPVIAGVIGVKKFIYDLWGDAVNIASRMESHGSPGSIQVTDAIYTQLKDKYVFEKRGAIAIKGRGEMTTYWLLGKA
jgi:PAS domain S-box-containing protein